MSTLFALPLVFTVLCSVEEVPLWVDGYGPDGAELYKRASLLGIKEDTLRAFMQDATAPNQPPDAMMRHTETWRAEGVDLIEFLQEIVEDEVLPGNRENRVLYAIISTRDDDAIDWAISHVRKNLSNPIRTQHDTTRMMGLVWALGKTKRDEALDIVLKLQSKAFWSGEGAPEVDMEPFDRWTAEEVNSKAIQQIRLSAFTQISMLGTERAVKILGTGEGIAPDMQTG